jgi:hypothetical protein
MRKSAAEHPVNGLLGKLAAVEHRISTLKGPFDLFGIFLRDDAPGVWDLVVAAPWLKDSNMKSLDFLAGELQRTLRVEDLMKLSGIQIISPQTPINFETAGVPRAQATGEMREFSFNGIPIEMAHIITIRPSRSANASDRARRRKRSA